MTQNIGDERECHSTRQQANKPSTVVLVTAEELDRRSVFAAEIDRIQRCTEALRSPVGELDDGSVRTLRQRPDGPPSSGTLHLCAKSRKAQKTYRTVRLYSWVGIVRPAYRQDAFRHSRRANVSSGTCGHPAYRCSA